LRVVDFSAGVRADGFKHVLNRDGVAFVLAGRDGPAIKNQARDIQAGQSHGTAGNSFVASNQND
jgi:hypothetical protein